MVNKQGNERTGKQQMLALLLAAAMLMQLLPLGALQAKAEEATVSTTYMDAKATTREDGTVTVEYTPGESVEAIPVSAPSSSTPLIQWKGGATEEAAAWYVVDGSVTISNSIRVIGYVNLILKDDATLYATNGIQVNTYSWSPSQTGRLTIYGQEKGTGTLIAGTENGTYTNAGIGAVENTDCGTITINGGKITAYGPSTGHTAIGGANGKGGDAITINGGEIKAYSTDYNAIGLTGAALSKYQICDITINGGTVTAESKTGTAIFGTNVTLGGEAVVNASAGGNVAVIRANDAVTISGGTVTANCTSNAISGIDCTAVTISGGTITTDGAIKGAFTTGEDGSAVILADSISDKTNRESWSGLVCQANEGGIYSTDGTFTLAQDVTIPEKATLTIGEGQTLIVPDGVTLTVYRSSINNGSIKTENGGAIVVQAGANFALADNSSGAAVVDDASLLEEALPGLTFETGGEGGWKTEDSRQTQEDKGGALLALLLGGGIAVGTAIYFYVKSLRVPAEEEAAAEGEATEDRTGEATDEAVPNAAA